MAEKKQHNRWRCMMKGCNPYLIGEDQAQEHRDEHSEDETPHNVYKYPIRSEHGEKLAQERNKSGYYDQWNHGEKSLENRGFLNAGGGRMIPIGDQDEY